MLEILSITTTASPTRRLSWWTLYGQPALVLLFIISLVQNSFIALTSPAPDMAAFTDSARLYRDGFDPYDVANTNAPITLLPFVPLSALPERVAYTLWTLGGLMCLWVSLRAITRETHVPETQLLLVVVCLGGAMAARIGQITLWLLPFMTWAWRADRQGKSTAAGSWLGPLIYLKPFFGLFALYFVWRRDGRALCASVVSALACFSVGLLLGVGVTESWIRRLGAMTYMEPHVLNASWLALVTRLFTADRPQPEPTYTAWITTPHLSTTLGLIGIVGIASVSVWGLRRTTNRDQQWAIVGSAMLLMSPLGWIHYLPFVLGPFAALRLRQTPVIILAFLLLWIPDTWLASGSFGVLATATIGSAFTWGLLLAWGMVTLSRRPG